MPGEKADMNIKSKKPAVNHEEKPVGGRRRKRNADAAAE